MRERGSEQRNETLESCDAPGEREIQQARSRENRER
jgi:hypothetical protein